MQYYKYCIYNHRILFSFLCFELFWYLVVVEYAPCAASRNSRENIKLSEVRLLWFVVSHCLTNINNNNMTNSMSLSSSSTAADHKRTTIRESMIWYYFELFHIVYYCLHFQREMPQWTNTWTVYISSFIYYMVRLCDLVPSFCIRDTALNVSTKTW